MVRDGDEKIHIFTEIHIKMEEKGRNQIIRGIVKSELQLPVEKLSFELFSSQGEGEIIRVV